MTWKAQVLTVSDLAPGDTVGYNATFTAGQPMRIALLPAGYADGLRRELSSTSEKPGGWVMIHGQRAPILGRISMNLTVVDVSHIPGVAPGDPAVLLGPGITADDHARLAQTISYEILCGIHPCV
jgi:alanine racemase